MSPRHDKNIDNGDRNRKENIHIYGGYDSASIKRGEAHRSELTEYEIVLILTFIAAPLTLLVVYLLYALVIYCLHRNNSSGKRRGIADDTNSSCNCRWNSLRVNISGGAGGAVSRSRGNVAVHAGGAKDKGGEVYDRNGRLRSNGSFGNSYAHSNGTEGIVSESKSHENQYHGSKGLLTQHRADCVHRSWAGKQSTV